MKYLIKLLQNFIQNLTVYKRPWYQYDKYSFEKHNFYKHFGFRYQGSSPIPTSIKLKLNHIYRLPFRSHVPHLEINEVVLVLCHVVNKDYQPNSGDLQT